MVKEGKVKSNILKSKNCWKCKFCKYTLGKLIVKAKLNCVLPVPIGSSRNLNFEADVLETQSLWALLPMIFVISIFELTKTARSASKVLGVGSIGLLVYH